MYISKKPNIIQHRPPQNHDKGKFKKERTKKKATSKRENVKYLFHQPKYGKGSESVRQKKRIVRKVVRAYIQPPPNHGG